MKNTSLLQMIVRITGMILLILGIIFWMGNAHALIRIHILIGTILTIALLALTFLAYHAGVSKWLVLVAAIWALGLPIWGLAQDRIFPAAYLWLAQVLHLICGVGAIGVGEILGAQIRKKDV